MKETLAQRLLEQSGKPGSFGRLVLVALRDDFSAVLDGHDDNTGSRCRVSLDGHDCCRVCNRVEAAMVAAIEEDL